jgi:hypothetical protein
LVDLESEYQSILQRLGKKDRSELEGSLADEIDAQKGVIEQNIYRDKQHLAIVNFCADKFSAGSRLSGDTGYFWVRVEPLYGLHVKTFDIAIYNKVTHALVLVECKSALREARNELRDLKDKIEVTNARKVELENVVGDDISLLEFVLCVKAGDAPLAKPILASQNVACCLWSADVFGETLILEKLGPDSASEIVAGRLHHDSRLRERLLKGSQDKQSLRTITFLPSSHMATILEETIPQLRSELDRGQKDDFGLRDLKTLMTRELSLQNFDNEEQLALAIRVLHSALEAGVIIDKTATTTDEYEKRFRLASLTHQHRRLIEDCHNRYVAHHAKENALKRILQEYRERHPDIRGF